MAHLFHQNNTSPLILKIRSAIGEPHYSAILEPFTAICHDLYATRLRYNKKDITAYLENPQAPSLMADKRAFRDNPIILGKLSESLMSNARGKSPGPEGIPLEVFLKYHNEMQSMLEVYHSPFEQNSLPDKFCDATIVIVLTADKNPCGLQFLQAFITVKPRLLAFSPKSLLIGSIKSSILRCS